MDWEKHLGSFTAGMFGALMYPFGRERIGAMGFSVGHAGELGRRICGGKSSNVRRRGWGRSRRICSSMQYRIVRHSDEGKVKERLKTTETTANVSPNPD
jgi:hypothetical protein